MICIKTLFLGLKCHKCYFVANGFTIPVGIDYLHLIQSKNKINTYSEEFHTVTVNLHEDIDLIKRNFAKKLRYDIKQASNLPFNVNFYYGYKFHVDKLHYIYKLYKKFAKKKKYLLRVLIIFMNYLRTIFYICLKYW